MSWLFRVNPGGGGGGVPGHLARVLKGVLQPAPGITLVTGLVTASTPGLPEPGRLLGGGLMQRGVHSPVLQTGLAPEKPLDLRAGRAPHYQGAPLPLQGTPNLNPPEQTSTIHHKKKTNI